MSVVYPLFAFEKDDQSMFLITGQEGIAYHCEAILKMLSMFSGILWERGYASKSPRTECLELLAASLRFRSWMPLHYMRKP
jgi:hypothetical protein